MKLTTYLQHAGRPNSKAVSHFVKLADHLKASQLSVVAFVIGLLLCPIFGQAQVDVTATAGTMGPTTYTTLKGAFDAINAGTHQGDITIDINGNTTETAPCVLNASGSGSASYTSVGISPSGGVARTISGAIAAGSPLIDLNGADNVTIDGLNSGGNTLTIENTTASATSGTSTIRFIADATNNTITNCILKGAVSSSVATNGAIVFFSTGTTTGNDNNTISNCDIGPSGSNLPTKGILGNGSTTTTAIGNSGITITNNDIHDYFGAAVTSAGVATNGGCNTWSITNNRFYQSATRTWTTGALHNAINIANTTATSGAQGFTITGNIVGYATNTQTGTYTLTGSSGSFRGIVFNGITGGTVSNINNNTVAAVSVTGVTSSGTSSSAPFMGIYVNNGLANTNSNTIGSQTATGSLVYSTTSTSAAEMIGIMNFSLDSWTVNNNNIGGMTVTNAGTGAGNATGIRWNTAGTATTTVSGNTVGGSVSNSIQSTSTAAAAQVVGIFSANATTNASNNTIRNLTGAGGTGTTTGASVIGINVGTTAASHTISQNTIFNLTNTNTTAATVVTGIQFTGSTANVVERNLIYNLTSATNSTSAEINGIRVAGGTTQYRNNMIALGAGVSNAIGAAATNSSVAGIVGINEALGTNQFFHNSVYIGGTATSGSGSSYAFNGVQTTNTRSFRDNIFFNARTNSGATGKHYAVKINGTAPNPTGLTINNNIYFTNGTGGVFGFFNSADVANLAAWRTAVGQDAASLEGNPEYNDPTNAVPDLHIHPTNPSLAEGNGFDLGVVDDFDGQTRSGLTPVDIGADAGNFVANDILPPTITYTPLTFTCGTGNRTLTATITDASGVPTSGIGLPVLYWRINTGSWMSATGTHTGGNNYDFVFGAGVVAGDVVQYYIVAQDLAATPNVGAFPAAGAGGFTADPPAAATPPTTPSSYTISTTLSGTYTVGVGGSYTTLTAAVNAYNTSCLGGPVVFELTDATYNAGSGETFPITILQNPDASAVNTLTIRPAASNTATITGAVASGALIRLNGADFVMIDGSNSGGTDRNLTITNAATTAPNAIWISSAGSGAGATNNVIKNCNINVNAATTATATGISVSGSTINSAGADNDNITIQNNSINSSNIGIYANGTASVSAGGLDNLSVIGNTFTTSSLLLPVYGIEVGNAVSPTVSQNTINLMTSAATPPVGISLETGVTGASVSRNNITQVVSTNTSGYGGRGITIGTTSASSNITIDNNFISGVNGSNWTSFGNSSSAGIMVGVIGNSGTLTTTTGGVNIYYNSINMYGNYIGTSTTPGKITAALFVGSGASALDIRNNILVNSMNNTTASASNYAIYSSAANTAYTTIDFNDYFVSGAQGILGFIGSDRTTLADIQTGFGGNANSVNIAPVFVSATDLHLVPASNTGLNNLGTPIAGITTDIDNDTRSATTPDMGADEFTPPGCVAANGGTITPATASRCVGQTYTMTSVGAETGLGISYQWEVSTTGGGMGFSDVVGGSGATTVSYTTDPLSAGTYYYRLRVTCSTGPITGYSNELVVTVNPTPTASAGSNSPVCVGADLNLSVTTDIGTSFSWTGPNSFSSSDQNPTIMGVTLAAAGTYNVTVTAAGCTNTSSSVVVVNPLPAIASVTATPPTICTGQNSLLQVNLSAPSYCTSFAITSTVEAISLVQFAGIDNASACATGAGAGGALQDFTSISGNVVAGSTYPITVSGTTDGNFTNYFTAFFDWDQDGVFETAIPIGFITNTACVLQATNSITVPATALNGATRMRIVKDWVTGIAQAPPHPNYPSNPCGSYDFGQAEDYTINVTGGADITYAWSPATFLSSTTVPNPIATGVTSTTNYTVTVSNSATGCSTTGNVTVTVNPNVSAGTISGATPLCVGQTDTYTSDGTPGGTWSSDDNGIAMVNPATGLVTGVAAGSTNINYTVTTGCGSPVSTSKSITVQNLLTWYQDADGDTYGNPSVTTMACAAPMGYVANNTDCNDGNANVYPGAPEICDNSIDDDCDATTDETLITWTGAGDGVNWTNGANWNNGGAEPQACNDIVIPAGADVTVPAGANVVGRTLEVDLSAVLTVALTAIMTILP